MQETEPGLSMMFFCVRSSTEGLEQSRRWLGARKGVDTTLRKTEEFPGTIVQRSKKDDGEAGPSRRPHRRER